MKHLSSLLSVATHYDAFVLDLWGVIHDGQSLYPGVRGVLATLREQGKQVTLLSNAPRRAYKAAGVLTRLGVDASLYDHLLTSGEAVYGHMADQWGGGKHYYYIGPDKDMDLLSDLPYARAGLAQSKFLLATGFTHDDDPPESYTNMLETAQALKKPMICANPDRIVVRRSGEQLPCAGMLAETYEGMGGVVHWFGKPHKRVYELCLQRFTDMSKKRILAVGDNLDTDILGATRMGLDSALVTGGILKETLHPDGSTLDTARLEALIEATGARPTYVLPSLGGEESL